MGEGGGNERRRRGRRLSGSSFLSVFGWGGADADEENENENAEEETENADEEDNTALEGSLEPGYARSYKLLWQGAYVGMGGVGDGEREPIDVYRCIIRIERDAEEHDSFTLVVKKLVESEDDAGRQTQSHQSRSNRSYPHPPQYEETYNEEYRIAPNDSFGTSDKAARYDTMR